MSALLGGGSIESMARTASVDPELVRLAVDHRERLGAPTVSGCGTGTCAAIAPADVLPAGCRGCPLMSVRRM
ncbi:hypothetical protein [Flaviflexus equikiangi]|uniref:Uncharacterized protein n=2 Tax=Flaviflexus equikiangi TaxID=2758573 RepID=A0ABS2TG70_9ACTO|nr:hypothetical protein [Flaviflexus equikiangi]MBM9433641.1 hypothetical protein [Flaviflexus equikiangi]